MKKAILISILAIVVLFIAGCAPIYVCPDGSTAQRLEDCPEPEEQKQEPQDTEPVIVEIKPECPDSCDDANGCTRDSCSADTGYECVNTAITPCCGNTDCESASENYLSCRSDCPLPEMSDELKEILSHQSRIKSMKFTYYEVDNAEGRDYLIKGDLTRVDLAENVKRKSDYYFNTVYMDTSKRTANSYCAGFGWCSAEYKNRTTALDYDEYVIITPIELINKVEYAEIVGDEVLIEGYEARTIEYENKRGNTERIWLELYYGIPLKYEEIKMVGDVEEVLSSIEYGNMAVNAVRDSDVIMPEGLELVE